jgi:hypothetical protein
MYYNKKESKALPLTAQQPRFVNDSVNISLRIALISWENNK